MDYFGLSANHSYVAGARKKLSDFLATPEADRIAAAKAIVESDEHAAYQGVVTINQAEANFIDLVVRASDKLGEFFASWVPLSVGQAAIYKTRYDFETAVNMGHLAGGPPTRKFLSKQAATEVLPFQYFSEETMVPNLVNVAFDIAKYQEKEHALSRIAYAMRLARQQYIIATMLNQPLSTSVAAAIVAYYSTNPYNGRLPYVLDSQVQSGSVETTNILNVTTEGGLTRGVFMNIKTLATLQGRRVGSMFIPIAGTPWQAYWQQASIIAYTTSEGNQDVRKAIPPSKWEEAVNMSFEENGQYMNWFGMNLFVQPLNILPADYFLVSTDQPAVLGWDQLDAAISDEDPLNGKFRDMSKRYEARSIALAQPDVLLRHFQVGKFA